MFELESKTLSKIKLLSWQYVRECVSQDEFFRGRASERVTESLVSRCLGQCMSESVWLNVSEPRNQRTSGKSEHCEPGERVNE